jgi:carbonic anhydrase
LGLQQSPVDLSGSITAGLNPIALNYGDTAMRVVNNGHTIQCNTDSGSDMVIDGKKYALLQFHFHHPSEHLSDGWPYAMEMHLVHASADGQLAVLGVFIKPGATNQALAPIWSAMPSKQGPEIKRGSVRIRPAALLPANPENYRYHGSLTTPPCSEKVLWTVYRQPIEASRGQIKKFGDLFPMNARSAQPMNRRFLLTGK